MPSTDLVCSKLRFNKDWKFGPVQQLLPRGMRWVRYYGLHATAVYQKIRKKLKAILPADAGQFVMRRLQIARKNYQQRVSNRVQRILLFVRDVAVS